MKKLVSLLIFLTTISSSFSQVPRKVIRIFLLPNQSAELNERLRLPFRKLTSVPKSKVDVELEKSLGKLEGDTYSTGFRKVNLGQCILYWHRDTRNLEELGKLLSLLKDAESKVQNGICDVPFSALPKEAKSVVYNGLSVAPGAVKGSARCALQATANFSYNYMGQSMPLSFPSTLFNGQQANKMMNSVEEAFNKDDSTPNKPSRASNNSINQMGFELLIEPGIGGLAENEGVQSAVKFINDKYRNLETEYNAVESRLLDQLAEKTFGRGLSPDNFKLKDLEDKAKVNEKSGQFIGMLFHDPSMSAKEAEAMRTAEFQSVGLCLTFSAMKSEHNGSNVTIALSNPFKP